MNSQALKKPSEGEIHPAALTFLGSTIQMPCSKSLLCVNDSPWGQSHRGIFRPKQGFVAWGVLECILRILTWNMPSRVLGDVQRPHAFTAALPQAVTAVSSPTIAIKTFICWAVEL